MRTNYICLLHVKSISQLQSHSSHKAPRFQFLIRNKIRYFKSCMFTRRNGPPYKLIWRVHEENFVNIKNIDERKIIIRPGPFARELVESIKASFTITPLKVDFWSGSNIILQWPVVFGFFCYLPALIYGNCVSFVLPKFYRFRRVKNFFQLMNKTFTSDNANRCIVVQHVFALFGY